jgi:hypothetical protein
MRSSVLVLGVFFVLGFVILAGTRIRHATA